MKRRSDFAFVGYFEQQLKSAWPSTPGAASTVSFILAPPPRLCLPMVAYAVDTYPFKMLTILYLVLTTFYLNACT
jgi:hypothetical protein